MNLHAWLLASLAFFLIRYSFAAIDPNTIIPNICESIQPRLEIRDLARNGDQFTLFLLGLKMMQEANSSDPMSYYAIAGIHGFPYNDYDDALRCPQCPAGQGYCPHTSHLFAIWHRPYLALFERSLRAKVTLVANQYPNGPVKRRFLAAAQALRLPYWDFAKLAKAGDDILPSLITSQYVNVSGPQGNVEIENPLYSFKFRGAAAPDFTGSWQQETTRHPMSNNTTISRQDLAVAAVRDLHNPQGRNLRCNLYKLMYQNKSMDYFAGSLMYAGQPMWPYQNIESVHDDIHVAVGGFGDNMSTYGTMYYIPSSSFDPIFWLHHAMVDRMLAMWQVLYPESWIGTHNGTSTRTISSDMNVNGSTPLTPFIMNANGTSWTGDASRSIASFCYSYAEFNANATSAVVSKVINSLYSQDCLVGPQSSTTSTSAPASGALQPSGVNATIARRATTLVETNSLHSLSQAISGLATEEGAMRDYVANIQIDSTALGGMATVFIFDGPIGDDTSTWDDSPNFIGKKTFLAPNMQNMAGRIKKGSLSMNNALIDRVKSERISGMSNEEVAEYLKNNMQWKVVKAYGMIVPNDQAPGLVVSVVTADVMPAANHERLPVWGNAKLLSDITAGKSGGLEA